MILIMLCLSLLGIGISVPVPPDSGVVNVGKGSGYSISFVQASPTPGTKLVEGQTVAFNIVVKYDLRVTDKGRVVLVFQDQQHRALLPGAKQVALEVSRGSGTVTLSQELQIPVGVRRIDLSVPLMPSGFTRTDGELLMRFPVGRAE